MMPLDSHTHARQLCALANTRRRFLGGATGLLGGLWLATERSSAESSAAAIDPARPLAEQERGDLLWIRKGFLDHEGPLEKVAVHGHTIFEHVMDCGSRIGIDTGAFRSGLLTALVLEGEQRRILQARAREDGAVQIITGDRPD